MQIFDYESAAQLNDVKIVLTRQEAEELATYLSAMLHRPAVKAVHLTEVDSCSIEKDVRFEIAAEAFSAA